MTPTSKPKVVFSNYDNIKNPFYAGGGAYAIHETAKRLVNDYKVIVVTGKHPHAKDFEQDGVTYIHIGAKTGPKTGQIIYQLALMSYINKIDSDIWFESFTPPTTTAFLPLFTKKRVIGITHMLCAEDMEKKYKLPFKWIEKLGLKFYHEVITLSDSQSQQVQKINDHIEILTIPNGINKPNVPYQERNKQNILFIGRIEIDQKGIDLLLESFKKLLVKNPHLKLTIAGDGTKNEISKMQKFINQLGIRENIEYIGRVQDHKKDALFRQSGCVVIPSRRESFSVVALEALSYGLPIVCFDIEGLKWIKNEVSYKVSPFNTDDLSHKLQECITNLSEDQKVFTQARAFVDQYSWDSITLAYKNVIKKGLNQ